MQKSLRNTKEIFPLKKIILLAYVISVLHNSSLSLQFVHFLLNKRNMKNTHIFANEKTE